MKKNPKGHVGGGIPAYKLGVGGREGHGLEGETSALAAPPTGTKLSLLGEPSSLPLGLSFCDRPRRAEVRCGLQDIFLLVQRSWKAEEKKSEGRAATWS